MADFLLGAVAGVFIVFVFLNLGTGKAITLGGYTKKSDDTRRFWNVNAAYVTGFLGALVLLIYL